MKEKRFKRGILLAVLALLLLIPTSITLAKYTAVNDVGTVTLTITGDPPVSTVLDQNWQSANGDLLSGMTKLVVDSFKAQSANLNGLEWDRGTPIGAKDTEGNFTNGVRLFEVDNTAYILARGTGSVEFPENSTSLFSNLQSVETITFSSFNTSNVTSMNSMFYGCRALTSLDLSNFDTSKVTSMNSMFNNCSALTSLNLRSFNTENVTNMNYMFKDCRSLTSLDLSNFETKNVTRMNSMFNNCSALTSLNLRSFNTENVTSMDYMFTNCKTLKKVTLGEKFQFNLGESYLPPQSSSNITGADGLWYIDKENGYAPADVAGLARTEATTYYAVKTEAPDAPPAVLDKSFRSQIPETATKLVLGSWKDLKDYLPENATWGSGIIYVGEKVNGTYSDQVKLFMGEDGTTAYVLAKGSLPVTFPKDSVYLFSSQKLTDIKFDNIDTHNVTDMGRMFFSCIKLTSLDLTGFDTRQVTDMHWMFVGCQVLTSLNVTSFDTRNVKYMDGMFAQCSKLTALDVTGFDTRNVFRVNAMFSGCSSLKQLDLSSFNTQKVTKMSDMSDMFKSCSKLEQVTLGKDFKFVGTDSYLPAQIESNIPGADKKWYYWDSSTSAVVGKTNAEVAAYYDGTATTTTTYYAVASKVPQH